MGRSRGDFIKYPRTPHIFGSEREDDDKRLSEKASLRFLRHPGLVVEEKVDGTNCGIHFSRSGDLVLQCRGHLVREGDHPQFNLLKQWANLNRDRLFSLLGTGFLIFGEWLFARHQIAYDRLPHYFVEFDIFDKEAGCFLDGAARDRVLAGSLISRVRVVSRGPLDGFDELLDLAGPSAYYDGLMEGLYLKAEEEGKVIGRAKYVRESFREGVAAAGQHWTKFPLRRNRLAEGMEIMRELI